MAAADNQAQMRALFDSFNQFFQEKDTKKQKVQEAVKGLFDVQRQVWFELQKVQQSPSDRAVHLQVIKDSRAQLAGVGKIFEAVLEVIGDDPVDAYTFAWRSAMSELCFFEAFLGWLDNGVLASKDDVDAALGLQNCRIQVDVEEYLFGLCSLPKELSRLCLNSVRDGNFQLPKTISAFVQELYSGFRLLNLRNDNLRRRFDGIKYDVQRIEEVLYDLTVRQLGGSEDQPSAVASGSAASGRPAAEDSKMQLE